MEGLAEGLRQSFLNYGFPVAERKACLKKLYIEIVERTKEIENALKLDFNKCSFDTYSTEIGIVLLELKHAIKHLKSYSKRKKIRTSIINFPSKGYIYSEGYGAVLVISPWNYPFQLAMCPVIAAISAGNYVALRPSSKTENTSNIMKDILDRVFKNDKVKVTASRTVLEERWDYIFFTGSGRMGKNVLTAASQNLTPVTLEMGGKSPCIVDKTANLKTAARRIAWGKFINAGQTCIAPDHIIVHESVKDEFVKCFIAEIKKQYYSTLGKLSEDFAHVITKEKVDKVLKMIEGEKILFGGKADGRILEPTIVEANYNSKIMQEEIFAPIAPILVFSDLKALINELRHKDKPLALYYFGDNFNEINKVSYGGGCHNDVIMHVSEHGLPFGGVGASGMGSYHGKKSFETFTHYKSVLKKNNIDVVPRFAPHSNGVEKLVKKIMK